METFFKAVGPDGMDFRTGTVDYAGICGTGEWLPVKPSVGYPECCTEDVYHASVTPEGTMIGSRWPCRLFIVTGTPVAWEGAKRGFFSLQVLEEVDAWKVFGPQGQEVAQLIERLGQLTPEDEDKLYAVWHTAVRHIAARVAARVAARDATWGAARGAARDAAWDAARYAVRDAVRHTARGAVRYATWDAILALMVRDKITPEHFDSLYAPWASVMEK